MERHDTIGRGGQGNVSSFSTPVVEDYKPVNATYNLPPEFISESEIPKQKTYDTSVPTADRIANSRLPDEIKRLMLEHPIQQPNSPLGGGGTTLSPDLVEKASRLMNTKANGEVIRETKQRNTNVTSNEPSVSKNEIRDIVRETVEDVLKENGLLVESSKKANEVFKFRVGQHIFEGKVTRIRKVSE